MKTALRIPMLLVLVLVMANCKKKVQLSAREEQLQNETTQPLLANEILEQEGIRFVLNYSQTDAQLHLRLDNRIDGEISGPALSTTQPYVNYSIEANKLAENSDYTISVEFNNVTNSGSFDLSVIGYTDLNMSKAFVISNNGFIPADNQTSKVFLRIRKGIRKFSFYKL